jgi:hypothetical protein
VFFVNLAYSAYLKESGHPSMKLASFETGSSAIKEKFLAILPGVPSLLFPFPQLIPAH